MSELVNKKVRICSVREREEVNKVFSYKFVDHSISDLKFSLDLNSVSQLSRYSKTPSEIQRTFSPEGLRSRVFKYKLMGVRVSPTINRVSLDSLRLFSRIIPGFKSYENNVEIIILIHSLGFKLGTYILFLNHILTGCTKNYGDLDDIVIRINNGWTFKN